VLGVQCLDCSTPLRFDDFKLHQRHLVAWGATSRRRAHRRQSDPVHRIRNVQPEYLGDPLLISTSMTGTPMLNEGCMPRRR
jgi:hypothetical protein